MSNADAVRREQLVISKKNEYDLRTSILRRNLAQAESMLCAAQWEPADVRANVAKSRALAVQEAREALDKHLGRDDQDTSWLY
jgi:hypothetical protein